MVKPILAESQLCEVIVPFSAKRLQAEYPAWTVRTLEILPEDSPLDALGMTELNNGRDT